MPYADPPGLAVQLLTEQEFPAPPASPYMLLKLALFPEDEARQIPTAVPSVSPVMLMMVLLSIVFISDDWR